MHDKPLRRWRSPAAFAAFGLLALAGCGSLTPGSLPAGTPIADARQTNGTPTGEYDLPAGGRRLEYARGGAYGRQTYMLDFDAQGRLVKSEQVLTDANFATIHRGMTGDEVRMRLGRPAWTDMVARPVRAKVWNYRYVEGDCLLFQVSIGDAGQVVDAAHGPDLACDAPNDGHGISR